VRKTLQPFFWASPGLLAMFVYRIRATERRVFDDVRIALFE
jgi:hypothetical protein